MADIPLMLGHRGARGNASAPENTQVAFDFALEERCDGFEFDVRLSADGEAVICHQARVDGKEISHTNSQALALPLLRDVLERYQHSAFLDIELKVGGLESITLDLLRTHTPERGCVISSFLPAVLRSLHCRDATVPLGLICETKQQLSLWAEIPVQYLILHHKLLHRDAFAEFKKSGKKVMVWTVNAALPMKRFAEWGVDGIISDNPAALVRNLRAK